MEHADLFALTAELAVVLAGFSGVVVALQRRYDEPHTMAYARLWRLVETGLASALFSLVPLALGALSVAEPLVWRVASLGFALYLVTQNLYFLWRFRALWLSSDVSWRFNGPAYAVTLGFVAWLSHNGLGPAPSAGPYFLAICAYLGLSALVFARLLLLRER